MNLQDWNVNELENELENNLESGLESELEKSLDETLHRSQILSSHNHYTQQIHEAFPQWKSAIFPEVGSEPS